MDGEELAETGMAMLYEAILDYLYNARQRADQAARTDVHRHTVRHRRRGAEGTGTRREGGTDAAVVVLAPVAFGAPANGGC